MCYLRSFSGFIAKNRLKYFSNDHYIFIVFGTFPAIILEVKFIERFGAQEIFKSLSMFTQNKVNFKEKVEILTQYLYTLLEFHKTRYKFIQSFII